MKILIIIAILLVLFLKLTIAQTFSNITYDPGTTINVGTGADICATNIIINGTYSGGGTICAGALPVSLSSFTSTVNKRDVTLMWVTEWELNNSGFVIERFQGGGNTWKEISFVAGHGTSNVPNGYIFKDEKLKTGSYQYRLKQMDYNGNYEYFSLESEVYINPPLNFEISQNYPNPSNPRSKIDYEIPFSGRVKITIYDLLGKEINVLVNELKEAGYYVTEFDGTNLSSGVYIYRFTAESPGKTFTKTLKLVLVK